MVAVITLCGIYIFFADRKLRTKFLSKPYNKIAIAYLSLGTIYLVVQTLIQPDMTTLVGYAIDFRFILVFLALQLVELNKATINKMLITIGAILGTIAILQVFVLPYDALTFFGYDRPGINTSGMPPATHVVAPNSDMYRAQATLRGPNELGAYLILPIFLSAFAYAKTGRKLFIGLGVLSVAGLLLSFSRSAAIGLIAATGLYLLISRPKKPVIDRKKLLVVAVAGLILAAAIGWKTNTIQTVVLRQGTGEVNVVESNQGHIELSQKAAKDMLQNPLGHGLGQAGPSSALDNPAEAVISENYFLQVGLEMGILGFVLLIALHITVLKELYKKREEFLGYPILLTFMALIFTNMLLHTWADEVVAITVWTIIGLHLSVVAAKKDTTSK